MSGKKIKGFIELIRRYVIYRHDFAAVAVFVKFMGLFSLYSVTFSL